MYCRQVFFLWSPPLWQVNAIVASFCYSLIFSTALNTESGSPKVSISQVIMFLVDKTQSSMSSKRHASFTRMTVKARSAAALCKAGGNIDNIKRLQRSELFCFIVARRLVDGFEYGRLSAPAHNFSIDIKQKSEHMHSDQHQAFSPAGRNLPSDLITLAAADGAQISVSLHGGHICSWRSADGIERLYLSALADWQSAAAIRGGIPVIFPQFASRGPLPKHGFARLCTWALIASSVRPNGDGFVQLALSDSAESRLQFPYSFKLELHITFSGMALNTELLVTNTGSQAFDFTCALHTYLSTGIAQSAIRGLAGCRHQNSVADSHLSFDGSGLLHIDDEVDSLFFQVEAPLELVTGDATLEMQQAGFPDVVVWNPWVEGCAKISDLENDAYRHFVCIESAAVEKPVTLAPGLQWGGHQQLTVCPLVHEKHEKKV